METATNASVVGSNLWLRKIHKPEGQMMETATNTLDVKSHWWLRKIHELQRAISVNGDLCLGCRKPSVASQNS